MTAEKQQVTEYLVYSTNATVSSRSGQISQGGGEVGSQPGPGGWGGLEDSDRMHWEAFCSPSSTGHAGGQEAVKARMIPYGSVVLLTASVYIASLLGLPIPL